MERYEEIKTKWKNFKTFKKKKNTPNKKCIFHGIFFSATRYLETPDYEQGMRKSSSTQKKKSVT